MIVVKQEKDRITITGHANYAEPGKDIVCSAISTLVQTLIQSVEELTTDKIEYSMQPGTVCIKFWCLSEPSRVLISAFFIGVEMIANEYPKNVKMAKH